MRRWNCVHWPVGRGDLACLGLPMDGEEMELGMGMAIMGAIVIRPV